jgi:hypothetical protein
MASYRATLRTPLDPSAAFAYLSRFDRAAEWDPGVAQAEMLTAEPVRVGSRFRLGARFLGRTLPLVYEIIELETQARVVLRAETAALRSTDTITFTADGSETLVGYDAVLETKGIARIFESLLAVAFRRIGDRAAAGLRAHLSAVPSI